MCISEPHCKRKEESQLGLLLLNFSLNRISVVVGLKAKIKLLHLVWFSWTYFSSSAPSPQAAQLYTPRSLCGVTGGYARANIWGLPREALYIGCEALSSWFPAWAPSWRDHGVALSTGTNTTEQGPAWEPYCPGAAQDWSSSSGAVVSGSSHCAASRSKCFLVSRLQASKLERLEFACSTQLHPAIPSADGLLGLRMSCVSRKPPFIFALGL